MNCETVKIEINLGNAAMQTEDDIAWALRELANKIEARREPERIMDLNGNKVGTVTYE